MIKNNSWESLIWILIWVFIISIIILWIANLLISSNYVIDKYQNEKTINIIKNNTQNIIKKLDTSKINNLENFYLYKDFENNMYKIFTWTTNEYYKYIDQYWNHIENTGSYIDSIYTRKIWIERSDYIIWEENKIFKIEISKIK